MKIASIDIGSNTVLLLICNINENNNLETILNEYRMPRIAKGIKKGENISEEKISEFIKVMDEYVEIIKKFNCEKVLTTATASLRLAANSNTIINLVEKKYGFKIKVISGEEEAKYSYLGAKTSFQKDKNETVVIDIGGASTEIIYGNDTKIKYSNSFNIGSVKLTERCIKSDPPNEEEIKKMYLTLDDIFSELPEMIPAETKVICVAGTSTTISSINLGNRQFDEDEIEASVVTNGELLKIIHEMKLKTNMEILHDYGEVVKGRNDVIFAGAIIMEYLMKKLKSDKFFISGKGIRYGAVINYLKTKGMNI